MNKWINEWINKFMNWLIIVNYQYPGKYCLTNKHLLYRYQARQTDKEADTGWGGARPSHPLWDFYAKKFPFFKLFGYLMEI